MEFKATLVQLLSSCIWQKSTSRLKWALFLAPSTQSFCKSQADSDENETNVDENSVPGLSSDSDPDDSDEDNGVIVEATKVSNISNLLLTLGIYKFFPH